MSTDNIDPAVAALPLETRIALTSGADFWTTVETPVSPTIFMSDGPNGVRKQEGASDHLGLNASLPATCFPPGPGMSQTWDVDLIGRVGEALADECRELGVDVLLGPGINIKRDPRAGRNFEYLSEDPLVSGVLGAAWVAALQSAGVGASVKHFAANNAEFGRMHMSSEVSDRALREIYLRAFERVVRTAQPATVMAAYNRINGTFATESAWLLTQVLRDEWGFEGVVVSDWGAVWDRVASLQAGLDLDMPSNPAHNEDIASAVRDGDLDEAVIDLAASRVARLARSVPQGRGGDAVFDRDEHHALAREVAGRAIVLLKNQGGLLPLAPEGSIAVIGELARTPRFQGGGSSNINPTRVDSALDEIARLAPSADIAFTPGYGADEDRQSLREDAVRAAAGADVAVVFLGLSDADESEGFDRDHIELPVDQLELIEAVVAVQPRTVVVLSHGGVVRLRPFVDAVPAVLDAALLGQAGGGAVADVLFGTVNPSGRLAETVPLRLEDAPSYLNFPGEMGQVHYGEGIFVGYRWYDARELEVEFPFGHGLSYTSFEYDRFAAQERGAAVELSLSVTNTGPVAGREVVQIYASKPDSQFERAPRELVGFAVVDVPAGGSSRVALSIPRSNLAIWHQPSQGWRVEGGEYVLSAAASSRDLRVEQRVDVAGDSLIGPISLESSLAAVAAHPGSGEILGYVFGAAGSPLAASDESFGMDMQKVAVSVPLRVAVDFAGPAIDRDRLRALIERANESAQ